jgi:hypothetical protein
MLLGVVVGLISLLLWLPFAWLLSGGTLMFWWGVVVLVPEPLKRPGIILMIIGTILIVAITLASYR